MDKRRTSNNAAFSRYSSMLTAALYVLLASSSSHSSTYTYLKQETLLHDREAKALHREIREQSRALRFLDCPLEMIERQWRGIESVNVGISYLEKFITESQQCKPNYAPIIDDCQNDLRLYKDLSRNNKIISRAIVGVERENFRNNISSSQNLALMNAIDEALNKPTLCYTQRFSWTGGYILTGSTGFSRMECYTPLGRRFIKRGPSIGVGIGVAALYSWPNLDSRNKPTYQILLYQSPEKKVKHVSNIIGEIALLGGANIEQDYARTFREEQDGLTYVFDIKPTIGLGVSETNNHTFYYQKELSPFYLPLRNVLDLKSMAQAAK